MQEDLFSEKAISELEQEGLTINWRYGYRLANRYEVKRMCPPGGFGIVWIVEDEMERGKIYAAKAPKAYFRKFTDPKEGEKRQSLANMFLNECKIWVDLGKHRHIVQAEFLEKIEGVPLVMSEYIDGGDLEHILEEKEMDIPTILDYAIQCCLGMEYANEKGVNVHRDIKPGNIMVTKDNVAKINDFGLAKAIEAVEPMMVKEKSEAPSEVGLETVSRGRGTPPYMAPEQFPEEILKLCNCLVPPITTRSDIFSFGLVLYEMVSGTPAFAIITPDYKEIFVKSNEVYNQLSPKLREGWSADRISCLLRWHSLTPELLTCNEYLDDIIIKCLNIDPEERYEGFSELKGELIKVYRQVSGEDYVVIEEPAYKPSWTNLGKTYWILGREEEAFEAYDKALEENPGDTLIWRQKGFTSAEAGDLKEFGLCMEVIAYIAPGRQNVLTGVSWLERYRTDILMQPDVLLRDIRLLDRLAAKYTISSHVKSQLRDWIPDESDDPFREPNPQALELLDWVKHKDVRRDIMSRLKAAKALGELGDRSVVPELIEALKDEDYVTRASAVHALWTLGDKAAVPALIKALRDEVFHVRTGVAAALGELGDRTAVPALIEALKDKEFKAGGWLASALGELGDKSAVLALIEALKDEDKLVRRAVAKALGKLQDASAVPALIEALKEEDSDVREQAAGALGELRDERAVSPLIEALKDEDDSVRRAAAEALVEIGDKSTIERLTQVLSDEKDYDVCMKVAESLAKLGDAMGITTLIRALKSQNLSVRGDAAWALAELGDKRAVKPLMEALKDKDKGVCADAAMALGELRDKQAVKALIKVLQDKKAQIRGDAAREKVKTASRGILQTDIRNPSKNAARALGELGDKRAVSPLIHALNYEDYDVRDEAARALGKLRDKQAVPALIKALKDEIYEVRRCAVRALAELGDERAVSPLIEALKDKDKGVCADAAMALRELRDKQAVKALIQAVNYEKSDVCSVGRALAEVGDGEAIPRLLATLASSPSPIYTLQALRWTCSSPDREKLSETKERLREYSAVEWNRRGAELTAQERYQEALNCFEKALEIDPDWQKPKKGKEECLRSLAKAGWTVC